MKLIGALTSKPYAFTARPWELDIISSIDYHDTIGSNIQVSVKGSEILRVLPKVNDRINEEWITDKIRFSYDGIKQQRLFYPLLKDKGKFIKISWNYAFELIRNFFLARVHFEGSIGSLNDIETIYTFKQFLNKQGSDLLNNTSPLVSNDLRSNYLINKPLDSLKDTDVCLLVNINPRLELPFLNLKLRKYVLTQNLKINIIGPTMDLTYPVKIISNSMQDFYKIIEGKHKFSSKLINATDPVIFIGNNNLPANINNILNKSIKNNNIISRLIPSMGNIASMEINALNYKSPTNFKFRRKKMLYILNNDEIIVNKKKYQFIIYQGHHGSINANIADLILPGSTPLEKNGTHINIEGIQQDLNFCVKPPYLARNDWKILHALIYFFRQTTKYNNLNTLKNEISLLAPHKNLNNTLIIPNLNQNFKVRNSYFNSYHSNFYATDIICKNSNTLTLASSRFNTHIQNFLINKVNNDI